MQVRRLSIAPLPEPTLHACTYVTSSLASHSITLIQE